MSTADTERTAQLFTVEHVAAALSLSRKSVYRMCQDGRLEAVRLGEGTSAPLRIVSTSLMAMLQAGHARQRERRQA